MIAGRFVIGGFSQIGTGNRDYGMGIVRIDPRFLATNREASKWPRHTLVKLTLRTKEKNKSLYAILRPINPDDIPEKEERYYLCLEYDDRLVLNVQKGQEVEICLNKAGLIGQYMYFRGHPNIMVRAYLRYAFLTSIFTTIMGAIMWTIIRNLVR
jgi:hypothetical protein